jgi:glycerophosphoryl diester phosphodiesterase
MLNIAHRGARAFAPENTIEAISKAARMGANAVEIDVQMSADGQVLVYHDDSLVRCSDVQVRFPERAPWSFCRFTAAEVRSLDAGSWFVQDLQRPAPERQSYLRSLTFEEAAAWIDRADREHYASRNVRIPSLAECLTVCRELSLEAHVELKNIPRFYADLTRRVVEEVRALKMQAQVVISSFDHRQLVLTHDFDPKIRTAVLTSDRLYRPADYMARLQAYAYCPGSYGDYDTIGFQSVTGILDIEMVRELLAGGYLVNVWTENDPRRMQTLMQAGVTGIFTDYPNRLRDLLARPGTP